MFSSWSCISSDISTTPFTGSSLLPLAGSAACTKHLRMTPEWMTVFKAFGTYSEKMRVVSTCGHVNDLFPAAG